MSYLILCKQRVDGIALWWRADRCGYTTNVAEAGRYSKDEADSIARIRGQDFPVEESEIGKSLKPRTVICLDDAGNAAAIRTFEVAAPETNPKPGPVSECGHPCFIIGGPFIAEDPSCPIHGLNRGDSQ